MSVFVILILNYAFKIVANANICKVSCFSLIMQVAICIYTVNSAISL